MPVFLRNFWIKKINEIIDNKKQAIKQQQQQKTKS
jgi:hypothetical protein